MTPVPDRVKAIETMARALYESNGGLEWEHTHSEDRLRARATRMLAALEAEGWGLACTREVERLRDGIEVALANVKAAHDPSIDGHLGLLLSAESILRSLIVEAEATPPAREAEKPCKTCGGSGRDYVAFPKNPCPSCGGSGHATKGTGR